MFSVYVIRSERTDKIYIGQTADIEKRIFHHNSGREKYTEIASDWKLVYSKEYKTKQEALKSENFIKSQKSRVFI